LSLALGGLSTGVSPLQMAQAYSGFANLGVMNKAYAITKITTFDGYVLTQAKPEAVKITDQSTAYTMTFLLKNVVDNGTGKNAAFGRPTAGKTGSVELPHTKEFAGIKGVKDVWFVGYTPELTAAIWMGYDKTDREHYLTISGGSGPAVVFREVLSRALSNKPVVPFKIPSNYWLNSGKMYPSFTDEKDDKKPDRNNESLNNFGIDPNFFNSWLNPGETDKFPSKGKGKKR